jgi:hypothetical protein
MGSVCPGFRLTVVALVVALLVAGPLATGSVTGDTEESGPATEEAADQVVKCGFPIYEQLLKESSRSSSRYLAASGEHCDVYVESGFPTQNEIDTLVDEFDNNIWPKEIAVFGSIGRDRIDIILEEVDGPYGIGGYYVPGTWQIHIDVADMGNYGLEVAAHEFQHLILDKHDKNEELWLNEGMADWAINLVYGPDSILLGGHVNAFEEVPDNDLTVFDNYGYDYGSAYAFVQYLEEQFGGNTTIGELHNNQMNGLNSVEDTVNALGYSKTIEEIFSQWTVANFVDDPGIHDGEFGYSEIDIEVSVETSHENYPVDELADVNNWASDVITMANGDGRDLLVNFSGPAGRFGGHVVALSGSGWTVIEIDIDLYTQEGYAVVPDFGSDNFTAILVVAGYDGSDYKYTGEIIDIEPPKTVLSIDPANPDGNNGWYIERPYIGFASSEAADTYFWWNNASQKSYCPTCNPSVVPIAPEGVNILHYYSVDKFGNRESTKNHTFRLDTIAPVTNITTVPESADGQVGWFVSTVLISLDAGPDTEIYYYWDSGIKRKYNGTLIGEEGEHTLFFYSIDEAGNEEALRYYQIKVDTHTPSTTMETYPSEPNGLRGYFTTPPMIVLKSDEEVARISYSWDEGGETIYSGPLSAPEGEHILYYWAWDEAGNLDEKHTASFKVDSIAPEVDMKESPAFTDGKNGWYVTSPSITLETDPDGLIYYRWDFDDKKRYTGSFVPEEGVHVLHYWAEDPAGNMGEKHEVEFKIDSQVPETEISVSGTMESGWYTVVPLVSFETEEGAKLFYTTDNGSQNIYSVPFPVQDGAHTIRYHAEDPAGNVEEERIYTLQVDSAEPVAYISISPLAPLVGDEVRFDGSRSNDANGILKYSFDFGDGFVDNYLPESITTHKYSEAGNYVVILEVEDGSGKRSRVEREIFVEALEKDEDGPTLEITNEMVAFGILVLVLIAMLLLVARSMKRRREIMQAWQEEAAARKNRPGKKKPGKRAVKKKVARPPGMVKKRKKVKKKAGSKRTAR